MTDKFSLPKCDNSDSTASTSIINETVDKNVTEYTALSNEHFWYSKPIVMNLTTQQIYFQLFTENNGKTKNNKKFCLKI